MQFDTESIRAAAHGLAGTLTEHRRTVHRQPEQGFQEHRTATYIEAVLDRIGVAHRRVAGTGVVAVVPGIDSTRAVGVRADMDALPVPEAPGRSYASEIPGWSHACGHDGHVACALGLAELLASVDDLPGSVAIYFQPAEEGPGGAEPMVAAGVLDDPAPQAVLALHVYNQYEAGVVALRSGPASGSADEFRIVVHGIGGHAAYPHTALDPIPVAAAIVQAVQQVVTREIDPVQPVVVTFGSIHGGTRHNVIAPAVELKGTFRTLHTQNRELLARRVAEVASGVASAHRTTADTDVTFGYPVGANDPALTAVLWEAAEAVGADVVDVPDPELGAEDFYAFGDTGIPVSMFYLGVANAARGIGAPHHSAEFDIEEAALPVGVAVFAEAARRLLA